MGQVRLNNLTKIYGKDVKAVKDIDLEIRDGEFLVLLGPSGCGKTTTMRMIAGLEDVSGGEIFLDGSEISHLEPRHRDIGMVFQNYALWPHMTVKENITFPLKLKKMPKAEQEEMVKKVAKITDIEQYLDRFPTQLSGGQKQRVAVARAVAVEPKVFLMDEPLSALDAKLRESMRTDLKQIQRETKATTIFVTHDQAEAMSMADRIVVMRDGEIMQVGTPAEVYNDCENVFIADFIGTPPTNFLNAKVEFKGEKCYIQTDIFKTLYEGSEKASLKRYDGKEVILGVRPENLLLVNDEEKDFDLDCLLVEPQGSFKVVISTYEENGKRFKVVVPGDVEVDSSKKLNIKFKDKRIMLFDKNTEMRIK